MRFSEKNGISIIIEETSTCWNSAIEDSCEKTNVNIPNMLEVENTWYKYVISSKTGEV
jgi:hypothetical protein